MLARRHVSAALIPCLLLSAMLWYITKLSYTYTATVPFKVSVEGQQFKVNCLVEATGYRLFANRYILRNRIELRLDDIETAPSAVNKNAYVLNPFSLQNIISVRKGDMRIISVGELPEIVIPPPEE